MSYKDEGEPSPIASSFPRLGRRRGGVGDRALCAQQVDEK